MFEEEGEFKTKGETTGECKMRSVHTSIKTMSNANLVKFINKIRMEKANPAVYGKYGTSKWVPDSEFWRGHIGELKAELAERKRKGLINKKAGVPHKQSNTWNRNPWDMW